MRHSLLRLSLLSPAVSLALAMPIVAACSSANQTANGGEPQFDASPPVTPDEDAGLPPLGKDPKWSELYADFFGGPRASCSGSGACHGDASQPGAKSSGGFVCPPGDKDACYTSMTTGDGKQVTPANASDPTQSGLYGILRKKTGGGSMPKSPPYAFTPDDMKRISDWIAAGAPND